ncbi:membrane protein [Ectobacillus antri]|jgi:uncharacterized membrane protein YczE|uniref:Membrane protein n=1 Tax=Ectobacillus antri TaxID=2486280 RepID=A0ABT6H784_9BACI|nr:membrane protein [Ectobacillus antri]MDG4657317.1 membrane protein [Ectobacillus antri]MDG5754331.1 membrane protein [Ectobacillus antri]
MIRFCFFVAGIVLLTLGVALTLKSNLGAGPWDALTAGQAATLGLTVGTWVIINGALLLFVNAFLVRGKPQFSAMLTFFGIGFMLDIWLLQMKGWQPEGDADRAATLTAGILLLALGVSMYLQSRYPVNPIDNLMLSLQKRFGTNLMASKTIGEVGALVLAIFLHGPVGWGTLLIAIVIGPLIQVLYDPVGAFMQKCGMSVKK